MIPSTPSHWRGTACWTHLALHVQKLEPSIKFYEQFTALRAIERHSDASSTGMNVVWLSDAVEGGRPTFVLVLLEGHPVGPLSGLPQLPLGPMSHLGFALNSREEVDEIAAHAKNLRILRQGPGFLNENAGYLCIIEDPDGHLIEFSHGQTLGPRMLADSGMRLQS